MNETIDFHAKNSTSNKKGVAIAGAPCFASSIDEMQGGSLPASMFSSQTEV